MPAATAGSPPDTRRQTEFYESNFLLGPAKLPKEGPVGAVVSGYERFGDLTADAFKQDYIVDGKKWNWPPSDGFRTQRWRTVRAGRPREDHAEARHPTRSVRLRRREVPSPTGTPFPERALPPQASKHRPTPGRTTKARCGRRTPSSRQATTTPTACRTRSTWTPAPSRRGSVSPAAVCEYMLMPGYVPDQPSDKLSVQWLLSHGLASGGKYPSEQLP